MMFAFKLQIFLMRQLWRIKTAYANTFSVDHNLRPPFSLMKANAQKTNFVGFGCFSDVLQIAKPSYFSQIIKRVVQFVAVDVVNMIFWLTASHIKPCQSMCQSFNVVNGDTNVPCAVNRPSAFPNKIGPPMVFAPSKNSGLRVIIQRFTQMLNGNVGFGSHDIQFTILRKA